MEKENTEGLLHPSMLQIRYLTELAKIGKKRGSVALIADTCGVSHGPVSRFFKECIGAGYLSEGYEFTEKGTRALKTYQRILKKSAPIWNGSGSRHPRSPKKQDSSLRT